MSVATSHIIFFRLLVVFALTICFGFQLKASAQTGPAGQWTADGNANDSVGNNHLTLHSSVTFEPGKSGQAFNFEGTGAYASTTLPTYSLSGGTVSLWFKTRSLGRQVITGSWNGNNGRTPTFYIDGGILYVELGDFVIQPVRQINSNQWYHVAMTYDSNFNVAVYVNGIFAKSGQSNHPGAFRNEVGFGAYIGDAGEAAQFFNGLIDDISIYNRPLTNEEILQVAGNVPPTLTLPGSFSTASTSGSGKVVTYSATATDPVSGSLPVNCNPPSGSNFPVGTTTVNCSVTDDAGNTVTGSFEVTVYDASNLTSKTYYTITEIGSFRTIDRPESYGESINSSGHVVGFSNDDSALYSRYPFLWQSGVLTDLRTIIGISPRWVYVRDINDSGVIVGEIANPEANSNFGALIIQNGVATNLHLAAWNSGVFPNLGPQNEGFTRAWKINNAGQIIGDLYDSPSQTMRGFIYHNGAFTALGGCPGYTGNEPRFQNSPLGINNLGDVVGNCTFSTGWSRGYLYSADGAVTELGSLGGAILATTPADINDSRKIVGTSYSSSDRNRAFLYENGVMTDLGALVSDADSYAYAINNLDQIVGSSYMNSQGLTHGFIYEGGVMKDINDLTQPNSYGPISACKDINDVGQIICSRRSNNGFYRAEILSPVQDTTAPQANVYDLTFAATSSAGAVGNFNFSVSDDWDRSPLIFFSHPSGTLFPIGATTVSYTLYDNSGNTRTGNFTVTVIDEPPALALPNDFTVFPAAGQETTVVAYEAAAYDAVDGPRPVACTPVSGSTFPLGWTIVNCTSTDSAGNTATGSFIVHVFGKQGDLDLGGFNGGQGSYFDPYYSVTRAMVLQPDGKIVVGGNTYGGGFSLARFNADGTPDASFGTDTTNGVGRSTPDFPNAANATVLALTMQEITMPDGSKVRKIVAAGQIGHDLWGEALNYGDFVIARYNLDGTLDTSFGSGGVTITDLPYFSLLTDVALQSDNKIIVSGLSRLNMSDGCNIVALRYTASGLPDTSFGNAGMAVIDFGEQYVKEEAYAVAVQPDDKIVIGGYLSPNSEGDYTSNNNWNIALVRLNRDGGLDTSFGAGGKAALDLKGNLPYSHEGIMGLTVQRDGKIVAVGEYFYEEVRSFLTTRHNADGSLDSTFGDGGKVITEMGGAYATDVVLQPDDKLVVLGGRGGFHLVRYNPNGALDQGFGNEGKISTPFYDDGVTDWWYTLARQPDGKLVVGGTRIDADCGNSCSYSTFVARYLAKSETVTGVSNKAAIYSGSNQTIRLSAAAAVKNSNTPLAQGTVTFQIKNGGTNVGAPVTAPIADGAASADYMLPGNTSVGSYTFEAVFNGGDAFSGSSSTGILTVGKAATSVSVVSETIASGATTHTIRAFIKENAYPSVAVNAGTVTFSVLQGTTIIGTAAASVSGGLASAAINTSALADGVYRVTASFGGTSNLYASAASGSFTKGNSANPVPAVSTLDPTSTEKSAASFTALTVNGTGFISASKIRARGFDPQAGTVVEQDLTTVFNSTEQLSAAAGANPVLSRMATVAQTLEISVVSPTPVGGVGGGVSNKQAFFVTDTPVVVTNVASSTTDPTTGTTTATTTTTTGGSLSATAVPGGGADTSAGTLTVAQYADDPIGSNSNSTSPAFSDTSGGYFDVHVSPVVAANYQTLSLSYCSSGGTTLYWWTGIEWALVVSQSYDSATGCINVTLNNTTSSPTITQLTGTVFGVSSGPAVKQLTVDASGPLTTGRQINLSASFADPGAAPGMTYEAEIFWGNGQKTTLQNVAPNVSLSASNAYPSAGVYMVGVKVTRNDGLFGSSNLSQFIVVTDPGGSVSGGGWISSPAGTYVPNPVSSGKATFGFTSKYQTGANVPTGNTQFTFHAAGMNFKSTAYEWLVIAGARAKYKGTGTINGAGSYGFMLTAVDGQVGGGGGTDKFRIKIWDTATGFVVYDNQMGGGDDAPVTTALGGGSIVIQKN